MRKLVLLTVIFFFLSVVFCQAAGGDPRRYHGTGRLTSFDTRTVTIEERGYSVDPSLLVVNPADRPTSLARLPIPSYVNFDYVYMQTAPKTMSPIIVYIKQLRQPAGSTRRRTR